MRVDRQKDVKYVKEPDGIYVYVWAGERTGGWRAILGLRFARECDALRAAAALTAAGLDTFKSLKKADVATVRRVATEFLQW